MYNTSRSLVGICSVVMESTNTPNYATKHTHSYFQFTLFRFNWFPLRFFFEQWRHHNRPHIDSGSENWSKSFKETDSIGTKRIRRIQKDKGNFFFITLTGSRISFSDVITGFSLTMRRTCVNQTLLSYECSLFCGIVMRIL